VKVLLAYIPVSMMCLMKCVSYQILESDDLPTAICRKCVANLEVCFELMQERIRGQNVFLRKISTQRVPVNWKHTQVVAITFFFYFSSYID
jgi:hypothetical protein